MNINILIYILVLHYIGDWLLQSRQMAENKYKISSDMLSHICIYTATLAFGMMFAYWPEMILNKPIWPSMVIFWPVLNGVAHFTVDAVTSNMTHRFYEAKRIGTFWNTIGFDQLCHGIILFSTYNWLAA